MSRVLKVDEFESQAIEAVLRAAEPETVRMPLNRMGYADFSWITHDNQVEHMEHKHCAEILSDINSVEDQLRKQLKVCSNLYLVVEDIAEPVHNGTKTYTLTPNGSHFRPVKLFGTPYNRYMGFLLGLEDAGIKVWFTSSWVGTANYILQRYRIAQKTERTTLNRYITPKVERFTPNPQVTALLGLCEGYKELYDLRIGPEAAERLIFVFRNLWNLIIQTPEDIAALVPGVSVARAKKLIEAIGRPR